MKKINFLILFFILLSSYSCVSQQLVETVNDAKKILENKEQFKNKPLKELLKEIKPPIKWAADASRYPFHALRFHFVDKKQLNSYWSQDKIPVTIIVYVKEGFEWDFQKDRHWTPEDTEKYGNLTMTGSFQVYGDADIEK